MALVSRWPPVNSKHTFPMISSRFILSATLAVLSASVACASPLLTDSFSYSDGQIDAVSSAWSGMAAARAAT